MTLHWLEAAAILLAVWAVRAWFWPYTACRRCKGSKTNKGSTKRRFGLCKKCGGSGSRQVLGARTVHRAVRSARSAWSARKDK